jgi:hypothetical protein
MAILRGCIKVGREGDTSSCIPLSERMVALSNLYMDEVTKLRGTILRGLEWCNTHYCVARVSTMVNLEFVLG